MMQQKQGLGLLQAIGNTPCISLSLSPTQGPCIRAKLEYLNPGGSLKDRTALYMIEQAEMRGHIQPTTTLIEASSGNQGIAVAMIGAIKGYAVLITIPKRTSQEKAATLEAYGARVLRCEETGPCGYRETALSLHQQLPDSYLLDQYYNPDNIDAHFHTTAPEIWQETEGQLTHILLPMGTCGAIVGIGRFLKQKNSAIQVLGVDAATSSFATQGFPTPYQVEGLGVDTLDGLIDHSVIDIIYHVNDEDTFAMTRKMAREYGLLIGLSSGAVMKILFDLLPSLSPSDHVVVLLADSGRSYLQKLGYGV